MMVALFSGRARPTCTRPGTRPWVCNVAVPGAAPLPLQSLVAGLRTAGAGAVQVVLQCEVLSQGERRRARAPRPKPGLWATELTRSRWKTSGGLVAAPAAPSQRRAPPLQVIAPARAPRAATLPASALQAMRPPASPSCWRSPASCRAP
jgi:hypothetical protein